jgi:NitT/TauT family transport system permease protein
MILKSLTDIFSPLHNLNKNVLRLMVAVQLIVFLVFWSASGMRFLPTPLEIVRAFNFLWTQEGLGVELVTSFLLNLQALALATMLSLLLSYASVIPFFRPAIVLIGKLRFLSMAGLTFFFTMLASSGHQLKLYLLVFAVSVFFIPSMADVIASVPKETFDLARTLRMGPWRTVWEVIVIGQSDKAFDALRQNAAMSWMMLTMVEGISRSAGGIGPMILDQNKYFHLDAVFAIQITILILGLGQDYAIGLFRKLVCPYADLKLERA